MRTQLPIIAALILMGLGTTYPQLTYAQEEYEATSENPDDIVTEDLSVSSDVSGEPQENSSDDQVIEEEPSTEEDQTAVEDAHQSQSNNEEVVHYAPTKSRSALLNVDYERIESLGLLTSPSEGSLGRDLWNDTRRSFISEFLPLMPQPTSSPTHQQMIMGLLLSEANSNLINKDIEIEPGKDILTLRLEKLNELGAYTQSYKLYSKLNEEPYHSNLGKAGIIAMMMNGEKSVACLEYKTMAERNFEDSFWNDLALYCGYVLTTDDTRASARMNMERAGTGILQEISKNEGLKINYTPSRFSELNEFERAILVSEERIGWPALSNGYIDELPLNHLGMFLARRDLSQDERFMVLNAAARKGLANSKMLGEFYTSVFDADLRQLENPDNLGWKQIPYSYQKAKLSRSESEKWQYVNAALPMMAQYGVSAFLPFAEILQTLDANEQNESTIVKGLEIISAAGANFPGKWARFYSQLTPQGETQSKLAFISAFMSPQSSGNLVESPQISQYLEMLPEEKRINYSNIIENLDKDYETIHNADRIYGKDFDLTLKDRYVMPTPRVWNQLIDSSENKRIGEAVLLTTVVLRDIPLGNNYPGVTSDVLHSLNTVGLTNLSRSLALEAILE